MGAITLAVHLDNSMLVSKRKRIINELEQIEFKADSVQKQTEAREMLNDNMEATIKRLHKEILITKYGK